MYFRKLFLRNFIQNWVAVKWLIAVLEIIINRLPGEIYYSKLYVLIFLYKKASFLKKEQKQKKTQTKPNTWNFNLLRKISYESKVV